MNTPLRGVSSGDGVRLATGSGPLLRAASRGIGTSGGGDAGSAEARVRGWLGEAADMRGTLSHFPVAYNPRAADKLRRR